MKPNLCPACLTLTFVIAAAAVIAVGYLLLVGG